MDKMGKWVKVWWT